MNEPTTSSLTSDGLELHVRHWPRAGARATVAIVHGWAEHGGRYAHVARALNERGYDVWGLDLRGHGRSQGQRGYVGDMEEHVVDVERFLARVRESTKGTQLFLLAHSLGGCISTLYVLRRKPKLAGLVLSGPALKLGDDFSPAKIVAGRFLGRFLPQLPIEKLDSRSVSRDPAVVRAYETDPLVVHGWVRAGFGLAFVRATEEIGQRMEEVELPLLIVQGGQDRLANRKGGADLHARARSTDKRIKIYETLFHEVLNEPEQKEVIEEIVSWFDARSEARTETTP